MSSNWNHIFSWGPWNKMTKLSEFLSFWRPIMWETLEMFWPSHACGLAVSTVPEPLVEFERKFGAKAHNTNSSSKMFSAKEQRFLHCSVVSWSSFLQLFHGRHMKNNLVCSGLNESTNSWHVTSNVHVSSMRLRKKTHEPHLRKKRCGLTCLLCQNTWNPTEMWLHRNRVAGRRVLALGCARPLWRGVLWTVLVRGASHSLGRCQNPSFSATFRSTFFSALSQYFPSVSVRHGCAAIMIWNWCHSASLRRREISWITRSDLKRPFPCWRRRRMRLRRFLVCPFTFAPVVSWISKGCLHALACCAIFPICRRETSSPLWRLRTTASPRIRFQHDVESRGPRLRCFGYQQESLEMLLGPMARSGEEPFGQHGERHTSSGAQASTLMLDGWWIWGFTKAEQHK